MPSFQKRSLDAVTFCSDVKKRGVWVGVVFGMVGGVWGGVWDGGWGLGRDGVWVRGCRGEGGDLPSLVGRP